MQNHEENPSISSESIDNQLVSIATMNRKSTPNKCLEATKERIANEQKNSAHEGDKDDEEMLTASG